MELCYLSLMDREMTRQELIRMRKAAGLSQADLATRLGSSKSRVSGVEVGRLGVNPEDVEAWAAACGYKVVVSFLPTDRAEKSTQVAADVADLTEDQQRVIESMIRLLRGESTK